ncbi:MAG TPA: S1C family serine protease [Virgibacillus sp.]|nr:S1C family serine protease [Virgibacillus sp.]
MNNQNNHNPYDDNHNNMENKENNMNQNSEQAYQTDEQMHHGPDTSENQSYNNEQNRKTSPDANQSNTGYNGSYNSSPLNNENHDPYENSSHKEQQTMQQSNQGNQEERGLNAPSKPKQPKKTKEPKQKNSGGRGGGHFFSGILGGVISAALIVGLLISGVVPIDNFTGDGDSNHIEQKQANDDHSSSDATQTISIDNAEESTDIEEVSQAVVGVKNMQKQDMWDSGEEAGSGSGIIYKKEDGKAYIVTNNHVVENAKEVEVVLNDDEQVKANVLGTDELTDLAVLEIDGENVDVVASLGSSSDMNVGETVLAIGNPLGEEFYGSVTRGIISGLDRSVEMDTNGDNQPDWITEVIQTDTAINPGNSGGALVNSDGDVIGINSMKIANEAVEGIGFAIPIDSAVPIIEQLESDGEISRPYIGISTAPLDQVPMQYQENIDLPDDVDKGMVIANVETGSPGDKAGLDQFDVITKINGEEITSTLDLRKYLYKETEIGDKVKIEFYRDGKKQEAELELAERED